MQIPSQLASKSQSTQLPDHPCIRCGSCCAHFRIVFHWSESLKESLGVPEDLSEAISPHLNVMRGTNSKPARCVALDGQVGSRAICSVYVNRPSCCRNFEASFENGKPNPRCDEARAAHGLKPLTAIDWLKP